MNLSRRIVALVIRLSAVVVAAVIALPSLRADVAQADLIFRASDGVELVYDLYLPGDGTGRHPVILSVTPFGRTSVFNQYVPHGYAQVNLQWRGTGMSGGVFRTTDDRLAQDIYEAVEWSAVQPWSDGNVGLLGGSIMATASFHAAAKQPPHLRASVSKGGFHDFYRSIFWHNGIFVSGFYAQILAAETAASWTAPLNSPSGLIAGISRFVKPEFFQIFADFATHPLDGPFWKDLAAYPKFADVRAPILFVGGWYDFVVGDGLRVYTSVPSRHKNLIVGPWVHGEVTGLSEAGFPNTAADASRPGPADPQLAWFDHFLKGVDNGIQGQPAVTYYDLGTDAWHTSNQWPPKQTSLDPFYLSGVRSGSALSLNDGSLKAAPPTALEPPASEYFYQPASGTGDVGSPSNAAILVPHVRQDQRLDEMTKLTFTTDALASPLRLAGPMELRFFASTDAADTDWIVKVTDVLPDGTSLILSEGFLRASHREVDPAMSRPGEPWMTNTQVEEIPAGVPLEYRIDMMPVAATLGVGHRLRVSIASSDVATHVALPPPARNVIVHDPAHPSRLLVTRSRSEQ